MSILISKKSHEFALELLIFKNLKMASSFMPFIALSSLILYIYWQLRQAPENILSPSKLKIETSN